MGLCVLELAEEQGEGAQCEPLAARRAEGDGGGRSTVGWRARSWEREARRRGGPDHAGVAPTRRIFTDYRSQLAGFSQAMEMMSTRMGSTGVRQQASERTAGEDHRSAAAEGHKAARRRKATRRRGGGKKSPVVGR